MATGTGSQVLDDLAAALGCSVSTVDDDEDSSSEDDDEREA